MNDRDDIRIKVIIQFGDNKQVSERYDLVEYEDAESLAEDLVEDLLTNLEDGDE